MSVNGHFSFLNPLRLFLHNCVGEPKEIEKKIPIYSMILNSSIYPHNYVVPP